MAGNPGLLRGSILGATSFAIDLNTLAGELGHDSLALINDDASALMTVTLDGNVITLPAGAQLVLTGTRNSVALGMTSTVSPTPFRLMTSPSKVPPQFEAPGGTQVVTANIADGAVTEAKLEPAGDLNVLGAERAFVVDFDSAKLDLAGVSNSTVAVHRLFVLPQGAKLTRCWWETVTGFTSGTSTAQLTIGVETVAAAGIQTALVISNAKFTAPTEAVISLVLPQTATTFTAKTTSATKAIQVEVTVEALTAGRLVLHGTYSIGA